MCHVRRTEPRLRGLCKGICQTHCRWKAHDSAVLYSEVSMYFIQSGGNSWSWPYRKCLYICQLNFKATLTSVAQCKNTVQGLCLDEAIFYTLCHVSCETVVKVWDGSWRSTWGCGISSELLLVLCGDGQADRWDQTGISMDLWCLQMMLWSVVGARSMRMKLYPISTAYGTQLCGWDGPKWTGLVIGRRRRISEIWPKQASGVMCDGDVMSVLSGSESSWRWQRLKSCDSLWEW